MNVFDFGGTYELLPDPKLTNTVDGAVTVLKSGPVGGQEWVTVTGRVLVDVADLEDGEQPGLVEPQVFIVRSDRLGAVVRSFEDPAEQVAA